MQRLAESAPRAAAFVYRTSSIRLCSQKPCRTNIPCLGLGNSFVRLVARYAFNRPLRFLEHFRRGDLVSGLGYGAHSVSTSGGTFRNGSPRLIIALTASSLSARPSVLLCSP